MGAKEVREEAAVQIANIEARSNQLIRQRIRRRNVWIITLVVIVGCMSYPAYKFAQVKLSEMQSATPSKSNAHEENRHSAIKLGRGVGVLGDTPGLS